jgi:excisionase family DNA binding protein
MDELFTVAQAAAAMNTSVRFIRRLVDERRIQYVHLGRHVRIPASAVAAFIAAGTVEPLTVRRGQRRVA